MRSERLARGLGAFVVLFLLAGGSSEAHSWPLCTRLAAPPSTSHSDPTGNSAYPPNEHVTVTSALMF